jgi:hypothetical protein
VLSHLMRHMKHWFHQLYIRYNFCYRPFDLLQVAVRSVFVKVNYYVFLINSYDHVGQCLVFAQVGALYNKNFICNFLLELCNELLFFVCFAFLGS